MDHQEKVLHFMRHGSSRCSGQASDVLSMCMADVMAAHGKAMHFALTKHEP